ncbi:MAG: hypothetical protein ABSD56_09145 [Bryobacteraceae bacterium]
MLRQFTILVAFAAASVSAQAQSCTRDSLRALIANYFKAVETHDMSALPTAADLRITENGQEMKAGEGFFRSGGHVHLERSLIDTERCGTVTQAVTDETIDGARTLAVMVVRLKVDQGKVREIETLVTRAEMKGFYDPQTLLGTANQDWTTPLPAGRRLTREYMNAGANQYFDAFSKNPPAIPPFATPCHRWEGGMHATRDGDCMPKNLVLTHTHRRFPVTDLELGITAGFINFAEALPDVHIFKYNADGKIEMIQAVFGGRQRGLIWPDEKK